MSSEPDASSTLKCPQCGGANPLPAGQRLVVCAFCDATLFVDRSGLVSHYHLPRLLDAAAAQAALKRWMAGNDTVKGLEDRSTIAEVAAVSFPMWLFRIGEPGREEVVVEPAAPTPIPHIADLSVPAGKLEPYRPEGDDVEEIAATVPLTTARDWLGAGAAAKVRETDLVQVPLWRCRYLYGGDSYTALVEASTGAVFASVFPHKAESPYYLTAGVGLVLFVVEGLAISNPIFKLLAYAVTGVPLALVAYWVTRSV